MRLRYVEEPRPLGTGGALKFAEDMLHDRFLMLNGDVLTDIDVTAQIQAHEATGARATLALYPVEDPSAYGLVRLNDDNSVREFVEKPAPDQIDTNNISAGVYVLEKSVLDLLTKGEPASIERDVFPELVGNGLYGHVSHGYWKDIGTPERYLEATFDILEGSVATQVGERMGETFVVGRRRRRQRGPDRPRRAGRVRLPDRRGRAHRRPRGARTRRHRRREHVVEGAVVMNGAWIGADCTSATASSPRAPDRRPLPHRRPGRDRRARRDRRQQPGHEPRPAVPRRRPARRRPAVLSDDGACRGAAR